MVAAWKFFNFGCDQKTTEATNVISGAEIYSKIYLDYVWHIVVSQLP